MLMIRLRGIAGYNFYMRFADSFFVFTPKAELVLIGNFNNMVFTAKHRAMPNGACSIILRKRASLPAK